MPLNFTHQSHCHQLKLIFSPPYPNKMFNCDACNTLGFNHWLYMCHACDFGVHLTCTNDPPQPVTQTNMHQNQTNFTAFPNQAPAPQPQNMQQPGFTASRSAPQVPAQAPNYQPFNSPYAATGVPVNHGIQPPVMPFMQRQNNYLQILQRLQALLANSSSQHSFNQHHLQALLAGGGVGGFGGGVGGIGGGSGGLGGMQNLIQALSGVGDGAPDFLGNGLLGGGGNGGAGLNLLQGLLGGGGNGLDILGSNGGLSLLDSLGGLLGRSSF